MFRFYPAPGQPEVAITGVGIAGQNGLPLERAAEVMPELRALKLDDDGNLTGESRPLDGDELVAAAQEWAARAGLIVADEEGTVPNVALTPDEVREQLGLPDDAVIPVPGPAASSNAAQIGSDPPAAEASAAAAETAGVTRRPQEA